MIFAGDVIAVEPAVAQGNAAVWTTVAHGKDAAIGAAAQDQRNVEQHGFDELVGAERVCPQSRVPVVIKQRGGRALNWDAGFGGCCERHLGLTIAPRTAGMPTRPSLKFRGRRATSWIESNKIVRHVAFAADFCDRIIKLVLLTRSSIGTCR